MKCIYADNAATTPLDRDAFEAMKPYFFNEYGNASQPYAFARSAKKALRESREIIADCIGAQPEEIIFTSSGTESDNWAIKGSACTGQGKQAIVTSEIEHHAILNSCATLEHFGYPITYLPVNSQGQVQAATLTERIPEKARLVSIMLANNEIGTIQDIHSLAGIAHEHGALFHTDAVQAVGHIQLNVGKTEIDLLSASAHKFNGPKGIGFLYVRKGTPLLPYINGGGQEFGLRAGTENVAAIVGMSVALNKNINELVETSSRISAIEHAFLNSLHEKGVVFIKNGADAHIPGNLSLSFPGYDGESLLHRLDLMGICVSTGSACNGANTQISHVLKAINLDKSLAKCTIRISLGKDNTKKEVEAIAAALYKITNNNRTPNHECC